MSESFSAPEFFAALDARIARYDLLQHPFYQAWSKGELTRDELREYASEYCTTSRPFRPTSARCTPAWKMRRCAAPSLRTWPTKKACPRAAPTAIYGWTLPPGWVRTRLTYAGARCSRRPQR